MHIGECSILAYCYVYTHLLTLIKHTKYKRQKEDEDCLQMDMELLFLTIYPGIIRTKGKEDKVCFVRKYRTQISCYLLRLNNKQ